MIYSATISCKHQPLIYSSNIQFRPERAAVVHCSCGLFACHSNYSPRSNISRIGAMDIDFISIRKAVVIAI
jgi:hypothetical protein